MGRRNRRRMAQGVENKTTMPTKKQRPQQSFVVPVGVSVEALGNRTKNTMNRETTLSNAAMSRSSDADNSSRASSNTMALTSNNAGNSSSTPSNVRVSRSSDVNNSTSTLSNTLTSRSSDAGNFSSTLSNAMATRSSDTGNSKDVLQGQNAADEAGAKRGKKKKRKKQQKPSIHRGPPETTSTVSDLDMTKSVQDKSQNKKATPNSAVQPSESVRQTPKVGTPPSPFSKTADEKKKKPCYKKREIEAGEQGQKPSNGVDNMGCGIQDKPQHEDATPTTADQHPESAQQTPKVGTSASPTSDTAAEKRKRRRNKKKGKKCEVAAGDQEQKLANGVENMGCSSPEGPEMQKHDNIKQQDDQQGPGAHAMSGLKSCGRDFHRSHKGLADRPDIAQAHHDKNLNAKAVDARYYIYSPISLPTGSLITIINENYDIKLLLTGFNTGPAFLTSITSGASNQSERCIRPAPQAAKAFV